MPANQTYTEKELLLHVSAGDEEAFEMLFKKYSRLLYSFLYRHTDDVQLADDLVQDIFTKIWLTRESLKEIDNFASYLFVLAKNHALNVLKKRIQERNREISWHLSAEPAEDKVTKEHFLDLIDRAVAQLPEQQQKTWIMSRKQGMKYTEIAAAMSISRETVKTYLQHANAGITKYVLANADLAVLLLLLKLF